MNRARSSRIALLLGALCALGVAAACSEDGVTTNCPAAPLYQTFPLGDASVPDATSGDTPAAKEALAASVAANCATPPNGDVGSPGKGGSSGAGGSSGKSGSGGKSGGGESGADSAGAAGRN